MTLILVRHGESEGNRARVTQGWLDSPLTATGRREAEAVAKRLASHAVVAVYASDLSRAADTGEALARPHGLRVEHRADLREQCFGERQGLTHREFIERWGEDARSGLGDIPGEETFVEFRARVAAEIDALLERHREEIAVCAVHGGTVRMAVGHVLGLPPEVYPTHHIDNCSITVLGFDRGQPTIVALNDACHLRGLGEAG